MPEPRLNLFLFISTYSKRLATIFPRLDRAVLIFRIVIVFDILSYNAEMSHPWMYGDRRTAAYREGVHSFRDAVDANKHGGGYMFCPCVECRNEKD